MNLEERMVVPSTTRATTIVSWNMCIDNLEQDRAYHLLATTPWDICCLQEVPRVFLERLKEKPPHGARIVYGIDSVRTNQRLKQPMPDFSVILSRLPITSHRSYRFPALPRLPLRAHAIRFLLGLFGKRLDSVQDRGFVRANIEINGTVVPVFSVHLTLRTPDVRARELEAVFTAAKGHIDIVVCGDLNVLAHPALNFLNFIYGDSLFNVRPHTKERTQIEARFKEQGLKNPLLGYPTHAIWGMKSQLDHILVPRNARVHGNPTVIGDLHGSDHHPVKLVVEL